MISISQPNALVLPHTEPRSPEWYAQRRNGITATDLPRIMGLSSYGNALSVWNDKLGRLPADESGEAAEWGHLLEPVVADEWARRMGYTLSTIGVLANPEHPWMRASCDRLIDGHNAAVEVKTRNAYVAGKWRDDMPDDVLAQVAWQRIVGQFDYVQVACLVGGQHLVTHRYEEDPDLEALLVESAWKVWESVLTKTPPPVEWDAVLIKLLDQLMPDRSGVTTIGHADAVALLMDYSSAASLEKVAKAAKESAKAHILHVMGEGEVLELEADASPGPLFTYRAQQRSSVNLDELEANDVELYEKILEGGHITTTTSRVLRTGKGASDVAT